LDKNDLPSVMQAQQSAQFSTLIDNEKEVAVPE